MAQVGISPDFFINEARNYAKPGQSFWRELFQNSVDAGANKIDITLTQKGDTHATVGFADNGSGMSQMVLEQVFFSLGRTTKQGGANVGGFGKARVLLCFAQDFYEIRTQNLLATGSHATYNIALQKDWVRGTTFSINTNLAVLKTDYDSFVQTLKDYLAYCQLPGVEVRINGVKFTSWLYRRAVARTLSFGNVHVNKSSSLGAVFVRVNGTLMFTRSLYNTDATVIVEIDPAKSRDVLLSNRDSLNSEAQDELDRFIQEIAANTMSALKTSNIVMEVSAGFPRRAPIKKAAPAAPTTGASIATAPNRAEAALIKNLHESPRAGIIGDVVIETLEEEEEIDPLTQGMIYRVKTGNSEFRRVARKFKPEYMHAEGQGRDRRKLLAQWDIALLYALRALADMGHEVSGGYRIGWVFDDEIEAEHLKMTDGSHALLLNPVNDKGVMRYSVRSYAHHVEMLTLACHEVAHIVAKYHDEYFASIFTDLVKETFKQAMECHVEMMKLP